MPFFADTYRNLRKELDEQSVSLIAVSKFKSKAEILEAYQAGQYDFGENYVQELCEKQEKLPNDIRWHFIGHLQSNKVRFLDGFHLVHSVDRTSLADTISVWGMKRGMPIDVLVQVNVVGEWTKGGYAPAMIEAEAARSNSNLAGLLFETSSGRRPDFHALPRISIDLARERPWRG